MDHHDETSPLTRLRETVRTGAEAARQAAESARQRDDVIGGAVRAGTAGTEAVRRGVTTLGKKANEGVSRAAKNLTLGDYRAEVDAALMEASEVIAAQAVRIAALEEQIRRLELAAPAPRPAGDITVETSSTTLENPEAESADDH